MCATLRVSASRACAPTLPATASRRSLPPLAVTRTVRAPRGTGSVVSSLRASRSTRFGSSSATPCDTIVRAKSTGSPPAPTSGISATTVNTESLARERFADRVETPLSDALQLVDAAVRERELRACDEILDGARDENLAGLRLRGNACSDRNGDSARLLSQQLALPGVKTGTDLELERTHVLCQCPRALDRPARTVESGEEAVAGSVDLRPVELREPPANESVMLLEQRKPRRVPELRRTFGGADDVGEEHCRQYSIALLRPADVHQEPFGLAHRLLLHLVVDPREEAAQPGQLGDHAPGDPLRDVVRLGALF